MKIFFCKTEKTDLVIFYDYAVKDIKEYIANPLGLKSEVVTKKHIIINFKILKLFIKNIFFLKINSSIIRKAIISYFASLIEVYDPKFVITFIDNSGIFHSLNKLNLKTKFFAIQNGRRMKISFHNYKVKNWDNEEVNKYVINNYFCFGNYEKDLFDQYNHEVENFFPVGSFKSSIYKNKIKKLPITYDICYVSCWKTSYFNPSNEFEEKFSKMLKNVDGALLKYINEKNIKSVIYMKNKRNSIEWNYLQKLFGDKVTIIPNNSNDIYKIMDLSKLIISTSSTATTEAFGWGKRVLHIDYDKIFIDYVEGLWLLRQPFYKSFRNRLDCLLGIDKNEYYKKTSEFSKYVMAYDPNQPTYVKIQNELKKYL